ncbi:MAG: hypothetical protein KC421_29795, partial [Anaerolineales bacterium]|nr:hypothetical protein [Anaerolineales bacterium]
MSELNGRSDFFSELKQELGDVIQTLADEWRNTGVSLRNGLRKMRGADIDYVVIPLGGALPEREAQPRSFIERQLPLPEPAFSMQELNRRLQAIGDADNVRGVLFVFRGFSAGLATL